MQEMATRDFETACNLISDSVRNLRNASAILRSLNIEICDNAYFGPNYEWLDAAANIQVLAGADKLSELSGVELRPTKDIDGEPDGYGKRIDVFGVSFLKMN